MHIRNMVTGDYPKAYALWMSITGMGLNPLDDSKEGVDRFIRRNPDTCFVAVEGDKVVGVVMAGHDGRRGHLYHVAVHPQYRKQGIARRLVDAALQALKHCGIHKVAFVVFAQNEDGNAFWEKLGFTARDDLVYRNKVISEMTRIDP